MAWFGAIAVSTVCNITMEVNMTLHVAMMCVVKQAAAWGQGGEAELRR